MCFIPKSTLISDQQKTENWLYIKHLGYELENCGICCFPQATQSTSLRACARAITTIEFNKFTADNGRLVACGTNNTTNNNRCWLFSFFFSMRKTLGIRSSGEFQMQVKMKGTEVRPANHERALIRTSITSRDWRLRSF